MARPPFYKRPEDLQVRIDEYFESCKPEFLKDDEGKIQTDKYGNPIVLDWKSPTITGLALALGFASRQALLNYEGRKIFHDTVSRAKLRVENSVENKLYDPRFKPQGPIFALKNLGWRDNIDVNNQVTEKMVFNVVPASTSPKEETPCDDDD